MYIMLNSCSRRLLKEEGEIRLFDKTRSIVTGKSKGALPNFIIVGAQKSATRWLRDVLNEHPDIYMASRELEFFNHNFDKGIYWYKQQFKDAGNVKAIGEATPSYTMLVYSPEEAAGRMKETIPDAKIIALLRDPVDRLSSAYIHHIRMGRIDPELNIMDKLKKIDPSPKNERLGLISGGWYAQSLEPYFKKFGDRVQVVLHEDIKNDSKQLYDKVLKHLDINIGYYPKDLVRVRHSNRKDVGDKALKSARLSKADRAEIYKRFFAKDVSKLEKQTGLDLSAWRKNSFVS